MNKAENEELFGDFGNMDDFGGFETESEGFGDVDDFDAKMAEDLNDMESGRSQSEASFMDERLREMNKKLPDWNLEPAFSFLK